MNCMKCGRRLLKPSASGFGPVCERAVLGPRKRKSEPKPAQRDTRTLEMFPDHLEVAGRVHSILGGISLEMNHG